jgi:hypothetical protein
MTLAFNLLKFDRMLLPGMVKPFYLSLYNWASYIIAETYLPTQRARHQIASLSLDENSVRRLAALPLAHRDPFDRMLVCQALEHNLTIITVDGAFQAYPAPILGRS